VVTPMTPMDVHSEIVDAETASGPMAILHKRPAAGGPWPRVVIFHDGPGVRSATHRFAEELAAEGYDVAVPDLFHRHGRLIGFEPHERAADPTIGERLWKMMGSMTDDEIQADLDATLATLGVAPTERLGTIGFCLGARAVYRTLVRLPDRFAAGAMWHPSFLVDEPDPPHRTAHELTRPLFVGIGDADKVQSIELQQPFFDAVAPLANVEVRVLPGADHGFTWPGAPTYDESAAAVCRERTLALFQQHLTPTGR